MSYALEFVSRGCITCPDRVLLDCTARSVTRRPHVTCALVGHPDAVAIYGPLCLDSLCRRSADNAHGCDSGVGSTVWMSDFGPESTFATSHRHVGHSRAARRECSVLLHGHYDLSTRQQQARRIQSKDYGKRIGRRITTALTTCTGSWREDGWRYRGR